MKINNLIQLEPAEISEKFLKKGSLIYIEGQISSRKYTDQSGVEKYITEIVFP